MTRYLGFQGRSVQSLQNGSDFRAPVRYSYLCGHPLYQMPVTTILTTCCRLTEEIHLKNTLAKAQHRMKPDPTPRYDFTYYMEYDEVGSEW